MISQPIHRPHRWRQATIRCTPGFEDIVSTLIFESGFSGIREEASDDSVILVATYDAVDGNAPTEILTNKLSEHFQNDSIPARITGIADIPVDDWETSWREGLDPVEVGQRFVVRPSWTSYENTDNRIEIIIDPKMSFGTGHHETTALCLEAIELLDISSKQIIDAGIGSGVLAIAAVKSGASAVHGFDHDEWSVANARENAAVNGVAERIRIDHASLADWDADPAPVIFANMISGVLVPHLPHFFSLLEPGGVIVFSGLLAEEQAMFTDAAHSAGFTIDRITCRGEWIAVYASRST